MSVAKRIKAAEFKAQCLDLMDQVAASGQTIVITKRGKPIAQLGPVVRIPRTLVGFLRDKVEITGDVIAPIDVSWGPKRRAKKRKK